MKETAVLIYNNKRNINKYKRYIYFMVFGKGLQKVAWNKGKINKVIQIWLICELEHKEWPTVKPKYCSRICYYKSKKGKRAHNKGKKWTEEQKLKLKGRPY